MRKKIFQLQVLQKHIQNIQFNKRNNVKKFYLLSFNELNFEYLKKYNQTGKLKNFNKIIIKLMKHLVVKIIIT